MAGRGISRHTLSLLLPVRDGAATLPAALGSLREQTLADVELVVVDDGSTDGSGALARRLWGPDLVLLRPGRVGLVRALALGLRACSGAYVARMDADDLCPPSRLERQAAFLDAHPEVAAVGSLVEIFASDGRPSQGQRRYAAWLNGLRTHEAMAREAFVESPLAHPSVTFRRDAILALGGYRDRGWPEDYDLWLRILAAGLRLGKVPEVLLRWRDHPRRASRTDPRYAPEAFLRLKAHFLARGPLADGREVVLWGARVARRLARLLEREGVRVRAFVDVDPRRIDGRRVLGPQALPRLRDAFLLACVGSRGAREAIRAAASEAGRREGEDFLCVA